LESAATPVLRLVDLVVRMQPSQGIIAHRAQNHDLLARLQGKRIIDFDGDYLCIARQIAGASVMSFGNSVRFIPLGARHS
jgi:hypothetical protein